MERQLEVSDNLAKPLCEHAMEALEDMTNSKGHLNAGPLVLGFMSNLALASVSATDFAVDTHNSEILPYAESFRASLAHLGNKTYEALSTADTNMNAVKITAFMLPSIFDDIVELFNDATPEEISEELPELGKKIMDKSDECKRRLNEIVDKFNYVNMIIAELNTGLAKKQGDLSRQIVANETESAQAAQQKTNHEKSFEDSKNKLHSAKRENDELYKDYLNHLRSKQSKGFWGRFVDNLFGEDNSAEVAYEKGSTARKERIAEKQKEFEQLEQRNEQIERQLHASLVELTRLQQEGITQKKAQEVLSKVAEYLAELRTQWTTLATYFNNIDTRIKKLLAEPLEELVNAANKRGKSSTGYVRKKFYRKLEPAYSVALGVKYLAGCYVAVSSRCYMPLMGKFGSILALTKEDAGKMGKENEGLFKMVQEAKEGIGSIVEEHAKELAEKSINREQKELM